MSSSRSAKRAETVLKRLEAENEAKSILVKWLGDKVLFNILPYDCVADLNPNKKIQCGQVYMIQTPEGAINGKLIHIGSKLECENVYNQTTIPEATYSSKRTPEPQAVQSPAKTRKIYNNNKSASATTSESVDSSSSQNSEYDPKKLLEKLDERDALIKKHEATIDQQNEDIYILKERLDSLLKASCKFKNLIRKDFSLF
jgi:hypothetical protein